MVSLYGNGTGQGVRIARWNDGPVVASSVSDAWPIEGHQCIRASAGRTDETEGVHCRRSNCIVLAAFGHRSDHFNNT